MSKTGTWYNLTSEAQNSGHRLPTFAEWFLGRRYLEEKHPQEERDFIEGPLEITGTVLDFDNEKLLEGIELSPDGFHFLVKSAKTRLGRKEGILLPPVSSYIKDLGEAYMPLASHLWGVADPQRELPDYAYLQIDPTGFKPVVSGGWHNSDDKRRVSLCAYYGPSYRRFTSRFVSDTKPDGLITPNEYITLQEQAAAKRAEIEGHLAEESRLHSNIKEAVVLIE